MHIEMSKICVSFASHFRFGPISFTSALGQTVVFREMKLPIFHEVAKLEIPILFFWVLLGLNVISCCLSFLFKFWL